MAEQNNRINHLGWLLLALCLPLLAWQAMPGRQVEIPLDLFLSAHSLLEMTSIAVAALVFFIAFGARDTQRSTRVVMSGCLFLATALFDAAHTLSYAGMPDFITPNSTDKSIWFWLAARYSAALGLMIYVVCPGDRPAGSRRRTALLAGTVTLFALVSTMILHHEARLPAMHIPGEGLTTLKVALEWLLVAMLLLTAFMLYRQRTGDYDTGTLTLAVLLMAAGELFFTVYVQVSSTANLLGHVYKVIAYYYLYRAIFTETVRRPFLRIAQLNSEVARERDLATGMLNTAQAIILLLNPEGRISHANPYFEQLTGFRLDDIRGKDWFDTLLPKRDHARIRELFSRSCGGTPTRGTMNTIVTRDGRERLIEWHDQRLFDTQGVFTGVLAIGQDVTERHQAVDELLRSNAILDAVNQAQSQLIAHRPSKDIFAGLLDALLDLTESQYGFIGEVLRNEAGAPYVRIRYISNIAWNDETRRMVDERGLDGLTFHKLDNLFGRAVLDRRVVIANDAPHDARRGGLPEGHPAIHAFMGIPIFEGDEIRAVIGLANRAGGYDPGIVTLIEPLTVAIRNIIDSLHMEQRRQEAESALQALNDQLEVRVLERTALMQAAKEEAERANAAKTEFLSRMSHELRTPLNAIMGFGQLIESEPGHPLSVLQQDNLQEILHAGEHLLALVNEVLDLARVEKGSLEIRPESIAAAPEIEACMRQIQPLAVRRGISLSFAPRLPCSVHADPTRLREVLLNLLSNAVKYNRENGSILIGCQTHGDALLRISVRDTGRGIAAEALPRLFRPFERLESAYEGIEGTGIGLALTRKLVEAMGGEIGVESTQGEGSLFWFTLPLAPEEPAGFAADPMARVLSTRNISLLHIEDNEANRRLLRAVTAMRPHIRLLESATAAEGITLATRERPSLILLDLNLPDMDGYRTFEQLAQLDDTRDIPVIAVSANAMSLDIERGRAAGFTDYLTKPVDIQQLLQILDHHFPSQPTESPSETKERHHDL